MMTMDERAREIKKSGEKKLLWHRAETALILAKEK